MLLSFANCDVASQVMQAFGVFSEDFFLVSGVAFALCQIRTATPSHACDLTLHVLCRLNAESSSPEMKPANDRKERKAGAGIKT
jgi:hypothetical protein